MQIIDLRKFFSLRRLAVTIFYIRFFILTSCRPRVSHVVIISQRFMTIKLYVTSYSNQFNNAVTNYKLSTLTVKIVCDLIQFAFLIVDVL